MIKKKHQCETCIYNFRAKGCPWLKIDDPWRPKHECKHKIVINTSNNDKN